MWRYVSDTQTIGGVPARDLTDAEFSKLEGWLQAIVRNSGLYRYEDAAQFALVGNTFVAEFRPDAPQITATFEQPAPARKPLARKK